MNLFSVRALAETGVDRISVGALTHSAPALDLALDYESRFAHHLSRRSVQIEPRIRVFSHGEASLNIRLLDRLRAVPGDYVPLERAGSEPRASAR